MYMTYKLEVAGLKRDLVVCPVNESISIAAFILFGDVEVTVACAKALLEIAPAHDIILTAEAKGIPLAYEMARQRGNIDYIVARKGIKIYMREVFSIDVQSITTRDKQKLHIDSAEAERMNGKRVLIVDDVISTGESVRALEILVNEAGGKVAGKMAVFAEGDAHTRDDIIYLEYLPLLDSDGLPLEIATVNSDIDDKKEFWDKLGHIEEINIATGLKNSGGQRDEYASVLKSAAHVIEDSIEKFPLLLDAEDMETLAQETQNIKALLSRIGATELSALALDLEIASADADILFCMKLLPVVIEDLNTIYEKLMDALALL